MAKRGIPDCPVLNPEHDGYGAAKLFRGHPYEESYSYSTTTVSNSPSTEIVTSNEDDDNDDDSYEDFYNTRNKNSSFYRVNINIVVNAGDATAMNNVLNLIKELHKLENE